MIGLISGGKDSLYSLIHCIRNGHRIVALANLYPKATTRTRRSQDGNDDNEEEEDTDSFMYQTVGYKVIPLYESALGIPLYRAPISRRGAVDRGLCYAPPTTTTEEEDETESLIPLLTTVKRNHPEANAISAGAILSTYQRTRVENVASRTGLVPLAWLWMYPFLPRPSPMEGEEEEEEYAGLLVDMAHCGGVEARIIKVASGGLDERFLWEDVTSSSSSNNNIRGRLVRIMRRFLSDDDGDEVRAAVLGEGGEYETLVLNGPSYLWKRRIVVDERAVIIGEGGVAYLKLSGARARCVDKNEEEDYIEDVRRPGLLEERFEAVLLLLLQQQQQGYYDDDDNVSEEEEEEVEVEGKERGGKGPCMTYHFNSSTDIWSLSNLTAPEAGPNADQQMQSIVQQVQKILQDKHHSPDDLVFATLLLRSMDDFIPVNTIYASLFTTNRPNPPARVAVASVNNRLLPAGVAVMVSFTGGGGGNTREGLHVQSRSYWAPANIGPYSQAISIPLVEAPRRVVYVAGQIPLEPASMELVQSSSWINTYLLRAVLSLQHLWRVGSAMRVDWWMFGIAFLTGGGEGKVRTKARVARHVWERLHEKVQQKEDDDEDDNELDPWDIKYGGGGANMIRKKKNPNDRPPPNFDLLSSSSSSSSSSSVPPFLAVQVDQLPRGSNIEWQGTGVKGCSRVAITTTTTDNNTTLDIDGGKVLTTAIEIQDASTLASTMQTVLADTNNAANSSVIQAILYTTMEVYPSQWWPGPVIPCRSVWGRDGRRLMAGMIVLSLRTL